MALLASVASADVSYVSAFGSNGSGSGQLNAPAGVATDSLGNVYVADTANNRIDKFDSSGTFVEAWGRGVNGGIGFETCTTSCHAGTSGAGDGELNGPEAIAIDSSDNLYVADTGSHRVDKFTSSGSFTEAWGWGVSDGSSAFQTCTSSCQTGIAGGGAGQIEQPFGIAVDAANVYVSDRNENRVDKFSLTGSFTEAWGWGVSTGASQFETCTSSCQAGSAGGGAGQFDIPLGIATGSGSVYVADGLNNRVDEFSAAGSFVRAWGWGVSDGSLAFQTCTASCQAGLARGGAGGLNSPFGVASDAAGNVFVGDNDNERVDEFSSSGSFVVTWGWGVSDDNSQFETCTSGCFNGQTGSGAGQFDTPQGVATHGSTIYVADVGNNRIEQFSNSPPNRTLTISKSGSGSGTVTSSPAGIDCGSSCSHQYAAGTPVTLTAAAASGSTFSGWSGGGCSGTGSCHVTLSGDTNVTATFSSATGPPTPQPFHEPIPAGALPRPRPPSAHVTLSDTQLGLDLRHHRALIELLCAARSGEKCKVRGSLFLRIHHRRMLLGSLSAHVGGGRVQTETIRLRLIASALVRTRVSGVLSLTSSAPGLGVVHLIKAVSMRPKSGRGPIVTTEAASDIEPPSYLATGSPGSALIAGTVDPNGSRTRYHFDVGFARGLYNVVVPAQDRAAGSDHVRHLVTADVQSLLADIPYHYRIVAESSNGIAYGADRSFNVPNMTPALGGVATPQTTAAGPVTLALTYGCAAFGSAVVEGGTVACTGSVTDPQPPALGPDVPVAPAAGFLDAQAPPGTVATTTGGPNAAVAYAVPPTRSQPVTVMYTLEHPHLGSLYTLAQGTGPPAQALAPNPVTPSVSVSVSCSRTHPGPLVPGRTISCTIATQNRGSDSADFEGFELAPSGGLAGGTTTAGAPPAVLPGLLLGGNGQPSTTTVRFRVRRGVRTGAALTLRLTVTGRNETDDQQRFTITQTSNTLRAGR